ncbi:MAG: MFS transporter [Micrococcales bacterium 70-64]|nr:MFS transporter [Leifsonia sp.]ODU64212.1 MAG: sugar transporter [Leifsonia sp. SCN 70-46]OJX85902.1 MAG: MFS transporter [Micrococcales bacterium 70-64]
MSQGTTSSKPFPWTGLFVLSALIFTSVTSEFLPTGLLPDIARDLDVSESQVGLLITVFAATVVVSAAPLTALTRRFPRKYLVIVVLFVFIVANVLAALAPTYELLAGARILGGLAHGLFWAVVGGYTGYLVPKKQLGRAVAITAGGGTAAFILGVPVGTALGHAVGWRLAFAAIAVIILALTIVAARLLPHVDNTVTLSTGEIGLPLRKDRSIPSVVLVCLTVILIMLGHNIFYTYIAPFLISPVGVDASAIAGVLFLYGGAGAIGLALAGVLADRFPRAGLVGAIALVALAVLVIALFPTQPVIVIGTMVVWSIAFGGAPAMLQTRMLQVASARIRDVASAYLTTSFNIAIGGGAAIGALLLDRTSILVLPFVDVAITLAAIVVFLVGDAIVTRRLRAR